MAERPGQVALHVVPLSREECVSFVDEHHRHLAAPLGAVFQVGVATDAGIVVGVAMVGRPVARHLDDGWTLEVNRCATDGTPNACSALYAASWRAARGLGWRRLITYTLASEGGASLRGAGWRVVAELSARAGWDTKSRPRVDRGADRQERIRWERTA